jgi:tetratricopeptide (TPR) repeat protein
MSIFSEIKELRASGNFEGAWQKGFPALESDPENNYLKTSLFWAIYDAFKQLTEPLKDREIKKPSSNEQKQIDLWATRIPLLRLTLPSENIDFRLWNIFRDCGKYCEPLCLFVLQSGRALFRPDDYVPYQSDKGESPSTAMRVARMVAANYLQHVNNSQLNPARVVALLRHAQESAQDSPQGKLWLDYDLARVFKAAGQIDKARKAYSAVIKRKGGESWAWFGLASTHLDDPKMAMCLTAYGLTCAHDPKFTVNGLMQMAELLAEAGSYEYASKILIRLTEIRNKEGWPIRDNIINMTSASWFDGSLNTKDLDAHIEKMADGANQLVLADPTYFSGVVQSIHESGKGASVYVSKERSFSVRKGLFPKQMIPKPGTYIRVLCDMGSETHDVVSSAATFPFQIKGSGLSTVKYSFPRF